MEDKDFDSLTVYDTSGPYSDPKYKHDYDKGLPKLKLNWTLKREDVTETTKTPLKYLNLKESNVKTFPNVSKNSKKDQRKKYNSALLCTKKI